MSKKKKNKSKINSPIVIALLTGFALGFFLTGIQELTFEIGANYNLTPAETAFAVFAILLIPIALIKLLWR